MNIRKMKSDKGQASARFAPRSLDIEARTVDVIWTTGSKGLRQGWQGPYYEELSLDQGHVDLSRLQGAPLLDSHDASKIGSVIGKVERASIEGGKGIATVRFASTPDAENIFTKVRESIVDSISVGYRVEQYTDVSKPNDDIPTLRATKWTPLEISVVSIPFDAQAKIRSTSFEDEVEIFTCETAGNKPSRNESKMNEQKKDPVSLERTRSLEINQAVSAADLPASVATDLIERGVTADQARKEIFARMSEAKTQPVVVNNVRVEMGSTSQDKMRENLTDSIASRLCPEYKPQNMAREFQNQSLLRLAEKYTGLRTPGLSDSQFANRVMSTSDFPYILADSASKAAQKRYELAPASWRRWASASTLKNYNPSSQVRGGDFPSLLERQEHGEFKQGAVGEERELVTLRDWGMIISFSRRALINDDLSQLMQISNEGGVSAARLENKLVYDVLKNNAAMNDTVALFHGDHGNLGTPGALSDTTIGEAVKLLRQQTSVDGLSKLNLTPKYLICGPENESLALKYLAQLSPNQASSVNPYSGMLELIVDAELNTNDYFFAAANVPSVCVFHLQGEEAPRIESRVHFETESVQFKVAFACTAGAVDYRGLVKNANAS